MPFIFTLILCASNINRSFIKKFLDQMISLQNFSEFLNVHNSTIQLSLLYENLFLNPNSFIELLEALLARINMASLFAVSLVI